MNCFYCEESEFFPRRELWKVEQTQIEFVELEELLIGEKTTLIRSEMNSHTRSEGFLKLALVSKYLPR